jgi:MFS family permease
MLARRVWRDFIAVTLSVGVVGVGLGSTMPLTALALTAHGFGPKVVGWMVAVAALGGMVGTIVAPAVAARFGRRRVLLCCLGLVGLSVIPLQYTTSLGIWAVLRFVFGFGLAPVFVIGEAWISLLPGDAVRGRVVAIYTTSFSLCQIVGPVLTNWLTRVPDRAFLICGGILLLGAPVMALARADAAHRSRSADDGTPNDEEAGLSWFTIMLQAPAMLAGIAFFAVFDNATLSFLPLFALDHGFSQSRALAAASVVLAGDACLQFAAGWLADRYGRVRVQFLCGALLCVLLPLLPVIVNAPALWLEYLYVLGGVAGSVYTLCMVASGERFSGITLVRASGLISLTWNIANGLGTAEMGAAMQRWGSTAMPWVLCAMAIVFALAAGLEARQRVQRASPVRLGAPN